MGSLRKAQDYITRLRITPATLQDLFHVFGIGAQSLQDPLLRLQPALLRGQTLPRGRLHLLQLSVFRPGIEEQHARAHPEACKQDDVEADDDAARIHRWEKADQRQRPPASKGDFKRTTPESSS